MSTDKNTSQQTFPEHANLKVKTHEETLKQVTSFAYLGSLIACNGSINPELNQRIDKASGVFNSFNKIWYNKNISLKIKIQIYESSVLTILLCYRNLANKQVTNTSLGGIPSVLPSVDSAGETFHPRNSEILQRTNQSQSKLLMEIKRFRWFRDLSYMDDGRLPKYLLEWHPRHGKRTWGRKRTTWLSCIEEGLEMITGRVGINYIQGRQMVLNRSRLGKMLRKVSEVVFGQPYPHDDDG